MFFAAVKDNVVDVSCCGCGVEDGLATVVFSDDVGPVVSNPTDLKSLNIEENKFETQGLQEGVYCRECFRSLIEEIALNEFDRV